MRVISPYKKYSITIFQHIERIVVDDRGSAHNIVANELGDDGAFVANFDQTGLMPHEAELALRTFKFTGVPEGVNPLSTIGVWDSEAAAMQNHWSPSRHAAICDRFRDLAEVYPTAIQVADDLRAPRPWPKYDIQDVEEILNYQDVLGISAETVQRYEKENQNRPEIVDVMTEKLAAEAVGEIVVAA